ncbi:MAG: hypothetical protein QF493_13070 [Rhodospirillales bacterium]|jgi:hypothetical protein|nr:hypothetical protein [Rhodospirillales bacterium]MDP7625866.1 hypothetical protein [Rhodospirillales bacterium]
MANVVLVHGMRAGGWLWHEVTNQICNAEHKFFTPTLTGLGVRAHLLTADINLETHIMDILKRY